MGEVQEAVNNFNGFTYWWSEPAWTGTEEQSEQNRICLANQLLTVGWDGGYITKYEQVPWTVEAVAGLYGNINKEDPRWNPGQYQSGVTNPEKGYGLVQWTPATKYQNWVAEQGLGNNWQMENQCYRLGMEVNKDYGQWYVRPQSPYKYSFYEYIQKTDEPEELAKAFYWNYEYSAAEDPTNRPQLARKWYNWLIENMDKIKPDQPQPTKSQFNWIYYLRRRRYG